NTSSRHRAPEGYHLILSLRKHPKHSVRAQHPYQLKAYTKPNTKPKHKIRGEKLQTKNCSPKSG
ncbi:hypothetical protein M8J77_021184, partial [Diaphorina citri]